MVHQLRKSYSLTDLNSDEPDYGTDLRAITNDTGMQQHNELIHAEKSSFWQEDNVLLASKAKINVF